MLCICASNSCCWSNLLLLDKRGPGRQNVQPALTLPCPHFSPCTSSLLLPLRIAPPLAAAAAVVGAEVEYLSAQLWQLPIMQHALEESEASGHTCAGDHCAAPGCGGGQGRLDGEQQHEEEEEQGGEQQRQMGVQGGGGAAYASQGM
jgi:hypothetical protein